jgi:hypothetical protein
MMRSAISRCQNDSGDKAKDLNSSGTENPAWFLEDSFPPGFIHSGI